MPAQAGQRAGKAASNAQGSSDQQPGRPASSGRSANCWRVLVIVGVASLQGLLFIAGVKLFHGHGDHTSPVAALMEHGVTLGRDLRPVPSASENQQGKVFLELRREPQTAQTTVAEQGMAVSGPGHIPPKSQTEAALLQLPTADANQKAASPQASDPTSQPATPATPVTAAPAALPAQSEASTDAGSSKAHADGITFVLTTWSGDKGGWPRVSMLIASLQKFAAPGLIHELLIVTPPADVHLLQKRAMSGFGLNPRPSFKVRVITDMDALGATGRQDEYKRLTPFAELSENGGRGTNYRISMLLKIGVAAEVRTACYMTLDSDVFLKRPASLEDLVPNGKALLQGFGGQQRPSWWRSSWNALGADSKCDPDQIGNDAFSIGVTPSIMSTDVVMGLLNKLGGRGKWDLALFRALNNEPSADWTEYTLYWTWACMSDQIQSHHTLVPGRHLYDERGFTELYSIADYPVDEVFKDTSSFFAVVQTVAGVSTDEVFQHIAPRLGFRST